MRRKEGKTYARFQACVKGALASKSHRGPHREHQAHAPLCQAAHQRLRAQQHDGPDLLGLQRVERDELVHAVDELCDKKNAGRYVNNELSEDGFTHRLVVKSRPAVRKATEWRSGSERF